MVKPVEAAAVEYAFSKGWIQLGEGLADIGLADVPKTRMEFKAIMEQIQKLVDEDQIPSAEVRRAADQGPTEVEKSAEAALEKRGIEVPRDPSAKWRQLVVPFGKNKGTTFGELEKGSLWWWCVKWQPTEYTARGKIHPPKDSDLALRVILNAVRDEYEFTDVQSSES